MVLVLLLAAAIAAIAAFVFFRQRNEAQSLLQAATQKADLDISSLKASRDAQVAQLQAEIEDLSRFKQVRDLVAETERIRTEAESIRAAGIAEAAEIRRAANLDAKTKRDNADAVVASANQQVDQIIKNANARAEEIAGDAYRALREADDLKASIKAMDNLIDGYGDKYLKPTYSLLDQLADNYGYDQAGQELKRAREHSAILVAKGRAATCEYVEASRKTTAIRFVIDAFNGKVDSILSRTKSDNHGTQEQQIKDAFSVVNHLGSAFRGARITDEYLQSRLEELKWAASVIALRERDREEQRRIREQLREEEKARREIDRALKEAAKEEEAIQKAMEKVQAQVAKASESQRAEFEAKLADLHAKLVDAEARNQRALSMAQQTKAGHVYIISNVGSLGENVLKVGMTRRLEPLDRIKELGDASVPFGFDVHAMIWSENAPKLERELHKKFLSTQVNKVNPRKEFFRVDVASLRKEIEALGMEASWTMAATAAEYRESLAIEQRMRDNPKVAEEWMRHQLAFESPSELLASANSDGQE